MVAGKLQRDAHLDARGHGQRGAQKQATLAEVDGRTEDGGVVAFEPAAAAHRRALICAGATPGFAWTLAFL
jgi:hypothetical protein